MPEESTDFGVSAATEGHVADPAAVSLAMGVAALNERVAAKAEAFLEKQARLVELQCEYIADKEHFEVSHLRWRRFTEQMKGLLQIMTAAIGLAVAVVLVILGWNASRADGLVVESISVPPAFLQAGIAGDIVADDLTHKIETIRDAALPQSFRGAKNVSNENGKSVKVEIPEIGVSAGEAWRYLRLWLGHERRISGNIRNLTDGKIALTVSLAGERSFTLTGPAGSLDQMEQNAAERVFSDIDPFNNILYLQATGRNVEALAAAARFAQTDQTLLDRASAYALWAAVIRGATGDMALAAARGHISLALDPKQVGGAREILLPAALLGHDEEALQQARAILTMKKEDQSTSWIAGAFESYIELSSYFRDSTLGDYANATSLKGGCPSCPPNSVIFRQAEYAARDHDLAASRESIEQASAMGPMTGGLAHSNMGGDPDRARYYFDVARDDWRAALHEANAFVASLQADPTAVQRLKDLRVNVQGLPLLAYAMARNGDFAAAHATIDRSPGDCYLCMRMRGRINALEKKWTSADYWFDRAVRSAPSIPSAYADWGQTLLQRDEFDAAIGKFELANQKGPHFADPIEMWGEALMAKNQSHLALAKFAEANTYAPNWGRLHLKWGEALVYAGKPDEAEVQFSRAAQLGLTDADKTELARQSSHA